MDYLARRNHSERELRQKLSPKYGPEEIEAALDYCREQNWITKPEALSEQTMNVLHRRKKGFLFIQRYLRQKGLPIPRRNPEIEEEKARELLERKFSGKIGDGESDEKKELSPDARRKVQMKAQRFLQSRGFEDSVIREAIRKVLYAK